MLGQKEICGLIILLCCTLARSFPTIGPFDCEAFILQEAEKLNNAAKDFFGIPSHATLYDSISTPLPRCNDHSKNETRSLIKAFYTLFQQLNETVAGAASFESLQTNLMQQKTCLEYWQVFSSPINITNKETEYTKKRVFLIKAFERYLCLMRRLLN